MLAQYDTVIVGRRLPLFSNYNYCLCQIDPNRIIRLELLKLAMLLLSQVFTVLRVRGCAPLHPELGQNLK